LPPAVGKTRPKDCALFCADFKNRSAVATAITAGGPLESRKARRFYLGVPLHSLRNNRRLATLRALVEPAALGGGVLRLPTHIIGVLFNTWRGWRRWRVGLAALPLVFSILIGAASAQELSDSQRAQLQAQKDTLFQRSLRDPGNLDTAFAYADVSAKLGDNEAAVSALERMLLFNPNLPRVQLELGALYFRMGSYEIARTYFDKALAANPPPEVKSRIDTYLTQIARFSAPQRFSGYIFFGTQYQTDANVAPGSPVVQSPLGPVLLNSEFTAKSDINVFGTGAFLYSYDLGTQERDTFDIGGTGFGNHYKSLHRLDLGLGELTAGPRFNFTEPMRMVSYASLKPYMIVNDVGLGGSQYFHTVGVGGEAAATIGKDLQVRGLFEFRDKNFNDAPERPQSRAFTGSDKLFSLFVTKPITIFPESALTLEFDYLDQTTRLAYYTNTSYAAAAAYRVRYDDPTGLLHYPWETTSYLSRSWSYYAGTDPCCNTSGNPNTFSTSTQFTRRWRFGVTQSFQVSDNIALILQLQRDIVSSNLSLYGYTNDSVLVGPQLRF
jgi:tetratricopeptide (TPR) repeat protein